MLAKTGKLIGLVCNSSMLLCAVLSTLKLSADGNYFVACNPSDLTACTNCKPDDTACLKSALNYCQRLLNTPNPSSTGIAQGVCIPSNYNTPQFQIPAKARAAGIPANIFNSCIVGSAANPCNAAKVKVPSGAQYNLYCRAYDDSANETPAQQQRLGKPGICLLTQF